MKTFKFGTYAVAVLCALTLSACGGGSSDETTSPSTPADPTPTDGSQTRADLAGYGYNCRSLTGYGTALNGSVLDQYIELDADGTFSFSSHIYESGSCSGGHGSGTGVSQVNMSGTYSVGGTNTTPSTSTKLTFTVTSSYWTLYDPQLHTVGLALANWANNCSGGSYAAYSTSATSGRVFNPTICNAFGNVDLGVSGLPPSVGAQFYNIGYRSSASSFQTGSTNNPPWSPSAGSFPSSYSITWTH